MVVTFNLKNCKFFIEGIDYPGHVTVHGHMELAEQTTDAVENLEHANTQTERRLFLGPCIVLRRFVPTSAGLTTPFNMELRKRQSKQFGLLDEMESAAVASLKRAIIITPALLLPRTEGQYTLDINACDKQIECVLFQEQ